MQSQISACKQCSSVSSASISCGRPFKVPLQGAMRWMQGLDMLTRIREPTRISIEFYSFEAVETAVPDEG